MRQFGRYGPNVEEVCPLWQSGSLAAWASHTSRLIAPSATIVELSLHVEGLSGWTCLLPCRAAKCTTLAGLLRSEQACKKQTNIKCASRKTLPSERVVRYQAPASKCLVIMFFRTLKICACLDLRCSLQMQATTSEGQLQPPTLTSSMHHG